MNKKNKNQTYILKSFLSFGVTWAKVVRVIPEYMILRLTFLRK